MPLFWSGSTFPGEKLALWQVREDFDELEALIPEKALKGDPSHGKGGERKRRERCAVRALLQEVHPPSLPLSYEEGRPISNDPERRISISHDHDLVGIQLVPKKHQAGMDLQRIRPEQLERVLPRFSSVEEMEFLKRLSGEERSAASNILWCAKEALFKGGAPSSFREGIHVEAFMPEAEGELLARTGESALKERRFRLRYRRFADHHMVHIVGEEFI